MLDPAEISHERLATITRWAQLTAAYRAGNLTVEAETEWEELQRNTEFTKWLNEINDPELTGKLVQQYADFDKQAGTATAKFHDDVYGERNNAMRATHRIHFLKTAWFRYAAAVLLLIIGFSVYFILNYTSHPETAVVQNVPPASGAEIEPGSNRAILTLSNGQQVQLNNATSETIKDGTLSIKNTNGQLSYTSGGSLSPAGGGGFASGETGGGSREARTAYNTMTTPRGGQYKLTLSDGTNVWLNAASSITYATAFTGATRTVSITGEAYFEVAKDKEKPFIVKTPKDEITVLGTSFNINAYENEPVSKTSLLEGSIKIDNRILKPGEAYSNKTIIKTNIAQDLAWKNGTFNFNDATLEVVMRQLERWYDIEIKFEGDVKQVKFGGGMDRGLTLQQVLRGLEGIGGLHFRIEGKTVIVKK